MLTDDDVAKSRVGRTLRGKYQLERVLGSGGMATVYAATHRNGKQFAIKLLHPELSRNEDIRARFLREGYVANRVSHPGAVSVIDDDLDDDGAAFLVMELLDGTSVEELWEKRRASLPVSMVLALGDQVLDVLRAAHARGVVHRDLKPANLFLTRDGTVKVLDFGIARLRDATAGQATATGTTLGTPAFMPPEQALGKTDELDAQSDLWALGATLFVLISGQLVHEGENSIQVLLNAATRPARSLASVALGVPRPVVALIDRALAYHKPERWSDASEMRSALQRAHLESFGRTVEPKPLATLYEVDRTALATPAPALEKSAGPPPAPQPPARPPLLIAGLLLIALAALGLLYLERRSDSAPAAAAAETSSRVVPADSAANAPHLAPALNQVAAGAPAPAQAITPHPPAHPAETPARGAARAATGAPVPVRKPPPPVTAPSVPPADASSPACARLLERQSLGETLNPSERALFAERCRR